MGPATPLVPYIASAVIAAGSTAYSVSEQKKAQKKAEKAQERAVQKQEEEIKKQGPQAQQFTETGTDEARLRRLRGGLLANIKSGNLGTSSALTAGTALGTKAKLGD